MEEKKIKNKFQTFINNSENFIYSNKRNKQINKFVTNSKQMYDIIGIIKIYIECINLIIKMKGY